MSESNIYTTGLRNVGSYQVSGTPWVTGSQLRAGVFEHEICFPYVTKRVLVKNTKTSSTKRLMRVHFESTGSTADVNNFRHYIVLDRKEIAILDVKCTKIYLSSPSKLNISYEVLAELTQIPSGSMYDLTGSGITS